MGDPVFPLEVGLIIVSAYLLAAVLIVWNIHTRFLVVMVAGVVALLAIFTPVFSPYRITVFIIAFGIALTSLAAMAGHVTLQWVQELTERMRS